MLSGIPKGIPVSFLGSISYLYNKDAEDNFDQKRYSLELLLGGAFGGDRIGFWSHQSLGNQNTTSTNSLSGPSDLYFVARHPFGIPVHLKAGKFAPDLSLWKTTLNGRMLSMGYSVDYSVTSAQNGLELSSILGSRVQAVVGVNDRNNSSDAKKPNSTNEYYGHLAVKFGSSDFHGKEPDVDLDKDSVWDYLSVSVGAFGYSGSTSKGDGVEHDLTRFGLEGEVAYKKALLMLGATFGENNAESDDPLKSTALSAEVNYIFTSQYALALRYDTLDVDGKDKRNVITPGIIYAPLQNFKLRLSAAIDSNPGNSATGKAESSTTATLQASMSF
jgi:hypothetical protein